MPGIRRLWIAGLGLLLSVAPCHADDEMSVEWISASVTTLYAAAIVVDSDRYFIDQRAMTFESFHRVHSFEQPMAPLEFQRSDALGRMIQVRSLSLVTLAETRNSRLFFGVNSDGLLGIHLRGSDNRHIEFARMPWLRRGLHPFR